MTCPACGERDVAEGKSTCYRCHLQSLGWTFRSAHLGRKGFHMSTVEAERKDLFDHAKQFGIDIERAR